MTIDVKNEMIKLKQYIEDNYNNPIRLIDDGELKIIVSAPYYNLTIKIVNKQKDSYIPNDPGIYLDYQANKENQARLDYHGGGSYELFATGNYTIIDDFLKKFECEKNNEKQLSIYDVITGDE